MGVCLESQNTSPCQVPSKKQINQIWQWKTAKLPRQLFPALWESNRETIFVDILLADFGHRVPDFHGDWRLKWSRSHGFGGTKKIRTRTTWHVLPQPWFLEENFQSAFPPKKKLLLKKIDLAAESHRTDFKFKRTEDSLHVSKSPENSHKLKICLLY